MKYFHYTDLNNHKTWSVCIDEIDSIYIKSHIGDNELKSSSIHTVFMDLNDGSFPTPIIMSSDFDRCREYIKHFEHVGFMMKDDGCTCYNPLNLSIEFVIQNSIAPYFSETIKD